MSSNRVKTPVDTEVLNEPQLSPEEMKLLEEYRAGRLAANPDKVVSTEDLAVLNAVDSQVKDLLHEVGLIEEQKSYLLSALKEARAQKNALLQDVMLKYGIPANQPFKINRDNGLVDFQQ